MASTKKRSGNSSGFQPLDHKKLIAAVNRLHKISMKDGYESLLVGGVAMQLHGSPRLTGDVDIVVEHDLKIPRKGKLTFGGYISQVSDVPVDVIRRSDKYVDLYEQALLFAGAKHKGVAMPVCNADYLCAMKIAARRDKDALDVNFLIINKKIDIVRTGRIVEDHLGSFGLDAFEEMIVDAEIAHDKDLAMKSLRKRLKDL